MSFNRQLNNCFVNITEEDISFVVKALKSDVISGKSAFVEQFENELAEYFELEYAVTCTNGTSAIQMALHVFGVQQGDEVMLPPTAPIMSVLPIVNIGAVPVFVDLQVEDSFNLSTQDIEQKRSNKTKAVMNVPMWGYPNNSQELKQYCIQTGVYFLEDLSHCHGTRLSNGHPAGLHGDISIFSTHERKMITTGEGGFLLTDNSDFYDALVRLRSFGAGKSHGYGLKFGLNYRLSGINAALGITQLKKIEQKIAQRTKNAQHLLSNISLSDRESEVVFQGRPNYYSLALLLDKKERSVTDFAKHLYKHNIVSDTYAYNYRPLYDMPLFERYKNRCLKAEHLIQSIITLPTHEGLTQDELRYVADIFNKYVA